jgi:hypothetical protein
MCRRYESDKKPSLADPYQHRLGLLFASGNGTPWDIDTGSKTQTLPPAEELGDRALRVSCFSPWQCTVMAQEQVPMATRQNRLGQSDARTTMGYTHAISEDGRRFAARFGQSRTCE